MIDLPILDTHLHVWDTDRLRYSWLKEVPPLNRPHLLRDYNQATQGLRVERMVFVQCEVDTQHYQEEARWVSALAAEDTRIEGIVPWAPLEKGAAVRPEIEKLLEENPLIRGIRRIIEFEPDPMFCLQDDFVSGVRLLGEFELSFDLCVQASQLEQVIELVRRCPGVRFVLDHVGKPDIAQGSLDPWREHVRTLAGMEQVWCKISGLVNEADHKNWKPAELQPYIDHAIACFGTDRIMFGGDWPVLTLASTYRQWVETLDAATSGLSSEERQKLFHDNGCACYRLSPTRE